MIVPSRCLAIFLLVLTLGLSACGGGDLAGAGGSGTGFGGSGVTTVTGNVSQVNGATALPSDSTYPRKLLAAVVGWTTSPANASTNPLEGILVIGGDQSTTTDSSGRFTLRMVTASDNFVLTFVFDDGEQLSLSIGALPAGASAEVNDVSLDTNRGLAVAAEVKINPGPPADVPGNPGNNSNNPNNGNNGQGNPNPGSGNNPGQGGLNGWGPDDNPGNGPPDSS